MLANLRNYRERIARVTWDEFRVRSRQEFAKRWDLLQFRRPEPKLGLEVAASGHFFFSSAELDLIVKFLRQRMPDVVEATIQQAERICQHQFDLLGYEGLDYGAEIDWHCDAVSGKRAPLKPWFKIHFLNYSEVGDVKVTWELNRHQHLVKLAKAYLFTGDQRFTEELLRQWYSWRQQNPYPLGVNWASSLEVAFRSISWLWLLHLLQNCPQASSGFKSDVQQMLMLSGRHIERYLSTYFSPNTHLLGEGVALFFLGVLCKSKLSARWKQQGWDIVLAQAERQVHSDGMHFEQSMYYHVYALDLFLHTRILATANGISVPKELDRELESMLETLCLMSRCGGPPRFGDDDGGRLFDPRRNCVGHLLDPLATGTVLFGRGDFKAAKPDLVEETVWLLGPETLQTFDSTPLRSPALDSTDFPTSGLYLMMSPGKPAARLAIDAGTDRGGHGHADALSIQVAIDGREVLIDPGTFVYAASGRERQLFRGTAAHNTVQVDGVDQAELVGPFPWHCLPEVQVENWVLGDSFDFLAASHNGYARLPDPVVHRRCVFGLKSQFWIVLDVLQGRGNHSADVAWHLASDLHWQLQAGCALASWQRGALVLLFAEEPGWSPHLRKGWCSAVYGSRNKSELLVLHQEGELPRSFATAILPHVDSSSNPGLFTQLHQDLADDNLLVYRYESSQESHFLFFSSHKPWQWRELGSDAEFLYYSVSESGQQKLIVCAGTYVEVAGERVVSCSRTLSRMEWSTENAHGSFSCSDESAVCSTDWVHLDPLKRWAAEVLAV